MFLQDHTFPAYALEAGKFCLSPLMIAGDVVRSSVSSGFELHLSEAFNKLIVP